MLETVAVIGAGTSGLVAARQLISAGLRPTIFEIAKNVGGAWTPSTTIRQHPASKMWNGMHTNLSKYTCRFSDWPWPDDASTFPSVEEMHVYLESYTAAFLSSSMCDFHFECKVFNVEQLLTREHSSSLAEDVATMTTTRPKAYNNYKVEWNDLNTNQNHRREFGGVIVAT
jgi:cation diffusion facilitator CzcD-associated flavoprotein CzcO